VAISGLKTSLIMKIWCSYFLLGVLFSVTAQAKEEKAPDWLKKIPVPLVGAFPLPTPGELRYTAGWSGLVVGKISIVFSNDATGQKLRATGGTVGLARTMYALDSEYTTVCDSQTLAPSMGTAVEVYSDEKRTTVQTFTTEQVTRQIVREPAEKDDGKTKIIHLPRVLDLQSSLLYLRSQALQVGDKITFLTYATGSPYLAKVSVVAQEEITVPAGRFPALKLQLELQGIDKKLRLKAYRKAKNISAWISDDSERRYLKFTADLLIGAVFVELEK
jgi:hypothetical protein